MAEYLGINIHSGNTTTEEVRRKTVQKWSQLGFLDHLGDNPQKENIASLLDGQASSLINETNTQESYGFETVAFPIVRRIFARLASQDLVPFNPTTGWDKIDFKPYNKIKKHKL
jgi:hypothetical protein